MTFQERMLQLRRTARITQDELAEYIGYSSNAVQNWERGKSTPTIDAAGKLADFFGVSIDYLTGRTNKKRPSE